MNLREKSSSSIHHSEFIIHTFSIDATTHEVSETSMNGKPSQYALVTGASSGIGECFARMLAARKQNLILVARSKEKLDALGRELSAAHGILAEPVECDLGIMGAA